MVIKMDRQTFTHRVYCLLFAIEHDNAKTKKKERRQQHDNGKIVKLKVKSDC